MGERSRHRAKNKKEITPAGYILPETIYLNKHVNTSRLSKKKFNELNQDAPHKASELHTYVVKLLSDRLAESNATIRALMR